MAEVVVDEGGEDIGRNIGDHTKPNPATALAALLHRGGDDGFILGGPTRLAGFRTADVALVDLDLAGQGLPIGPDHGGADLREPGPRRLIAAEPELALQFGGRDALLRRGDLEDGAEPKGERLLALFEDRPGDHRGPAGRSRRTRRPPASTAGSRLCHPRSGCSGSPPAVSTERGALGSGLHRRTDLGTRPRCSESWTGPSRTSDIIFVHLMFLFR